VPLAVKAGLAAWAEAAALAANATAEQIAIEYFDMTITPDLTEP
jgi:hypothetical protein